MIKGMPGSEQIYGHERVRDLGKTSLARRDNFILLLQRSSVTGTGEVTFGSSSVADLPHSRSSRRLVFAYCTSG